MSERVYIYTYIYTHRTFDIYQYYFFKVNNTVLINIHLIYIYHIKYDINYIFEKKFRYNKMAGGFIIAVLFFRHTLCDHLHAAANI